MDTLPVGQGIEAFIGTIWHSEALELLKSLPDSSVPCILVDPPYGNDNGGNDLAGERARDKVKGGRAKGAIKAIQNDTLQDWEILMPAFFQEANRVIKPKGTIISFISGGGGKRCYFATATLWLEEYASFFHALVWDKSARGYGLGWRYRRNYEMILIAGKKGHGVGWQKGRDAQPNVVYFAPCENLLHPTQKPPELIEWLIANHTEENDIVLDCFAGSGTTTIAARNLNRRFIAGDLSLEYCEIARQRLLNTDPYENSKLKDGTIQLSLFKDMKPE